MCACELSAHILRATHTAVRPDLRRRSGSPDRPTCCVVGRQPVGIRRALAVPSLSPLRELDQIATAWENCLVDLLKNAIGSIRLGVRDWGSKDHDELLSAVRNIHAGILLLYKEALRRLSPPGSSEVLLKMVINPARDADGNLIFVGQGKKTADVQQIRDRFTSLGIATDWPRFKRINSVRNDAEHYFPTVKESQLRGLISDAFVIVRDFVVSQLNENPRDLLGEDAWQEMLKVSEVFEPERRECERLLDSIDWVSDALRRGVRELACEECGSPLLRPNHSPARYDDIELECRACGENESHESFVPRAITTVLEYEKYLAAKDGGETPYVSCPECGEEAYVVEEGRCAACAHEAEHTCSMCGCNIPPEELEFSPLCGWCEHMMSKDD